MTAGGQRQTRPRGPPACLSAPGPATIMTRAWASMPGATESESHEQISETGVHRRPAGPAADGAVAADIQKAFLSNAAKALNMNAGFVQKIGYTRISVLNGYSILGYTIKGQLVSKKLTFLISGKYYEGIVSYQKSVMIYPNYYSHDSHDSHDSHGFNPNAGGGSND